MSLRQRGQRPSEATNEGGYYASSSIQQNQQKAPSSYSSSNNAGHQTPQQQPRRPSAPARRPSPPSAVGYNRSVSASGAYAMNNNVHQQPRVLPTSPSASTIYNAAYNNNAATSVPQPMMMQSRSKSYPINTAPPPYNHQNSSGSNANQPSTIHFDGSGGYGNGQGAVAAGGGITTNNTGYGSYTNLTAGNPNNASFNSSNSNVSSPSSHSANPYQTKSNSTGLSIKHILLSLLALTLLTLTGTSIYYRKVFKAIELEVDAAREAIKQREKRKDSRQGGRFGRVRSKLQNINSPRFNKRDNNNNNSNKEGNEEEKRQLMKAIENLQSEIKDNQARFTDLTNIHSSQTTMHDALSTKKQELLKALDHTKHQLEDGEENMEKYKAMVDGLEEVEVYMKKREGALWNRIDVLEGKIGTESWREAIEWFGPGPHRVEITLEYPKAIDPTTDPSTWPRTRNKLLLEMAPIDLLPHAVNLFLQQVHHQLWDGCSITNNAHHIFQLGPSYDNEEHKDRTQYDRFHDMGLDKVSFQEYSEQYTHGQWTVGMAGRPGGPDFYINKIDNSLIHGPGGQTNKHDLHNEADPCFGTIVMEGEGGGKQILDEISLIPTNPERGFEIKYPVVIVGAKVLAPMENPADGWREIKSGEKLVQDEIMPLPDVPHGV